MARAMTERTRGDEMMEEEFPFNLEAAVYYYLQENPDGELILHASDSTEALCLHTYFEVKPEYTSEVVSEELTRKNNKPTYGVRVARA